MPETKTPSAGSGAGADLPGVSIVVPTYRRPEAIERCLDALSRVEVPEGGVEVLVVEDGGPTEALARARGRSFGDLAVRWLAQPHSGPAAARNLGAAAATSEVLVFTDDDCRPRADWLSRIVAPLREDPRRLVGGHTSNAVEGNVFSAASQWLVNFITDDGSGRCDPFFASNNIALARREFYAIGGFDLSFPLAGGEDRDFCDRCIDAGLEFVHVREARIDHDHRLGLLSFLKQHYRYGRGAFQYQSSRTRRSGESFARRIDLDRYRAMICGPMAEYVGFRGLAISGLIGLAQVPNTLGFFVEAHRQRRRGSE